MMQSTRGSPSCIRHKAGQGTAALPLFLRIVLKAVGIDGQDVDTLAFQAADQVIHELQVAAHPVGAVEEQADAGLARLEAGSDIGFDAGGFFRGGVWVVQAFPGHRFRRFVAELAAQVCIAQEQEQVAEVVNSPAHQVGKGGFQFRHRHGAGGNQVFIPFLVARAGNQGYAPFVAKADQGIESVGHGPLAAQQPQQHHSGLSR